MCCTLSNDILHVLYPRVFAAIQKCHANLADLLMRAQCFTCGNTGGLMQPLPVQRRVTLRSSSTSMLAWKFACVTVTSTAWRNERHMLRRAAVSSRV